VLHTEDTHIYIYYFRVQWVGSASHRTQRDALVNAVVPSKNQVASLTEYIRKRNRDIFQIKRNRDTHTKSDCPRDSLSSRNNASTLHSSLLALRSSYIFRKVMLQYKILKSFKTSLPIFIIMGQHIFFFYSRLHFFLSRPASCFPSPSPRLRHRHRHRHPTIQSRLRLLYAGPHP